MPLLLILFRPWTFLGLHLISFLGLHLMMLIDGVHHTICCFHGLFVHVIWSLSLAGRCGSLSPSTSKGCAVWLLPDQGIPAWIEANFCSTSEGVHCLQWATQMMALEWGHPGCRVSTVSGTCLMHMGRIHISSCGYRDWRSSLEKLIW